MLWYVNGIVAKGCWSDNWSAPGESRQVFYRARPDDAAAVSRRQELKQQVRTRSCDRCVHKNICILYHGHGQLELRFGNSYVKDPATFIDKLDERLAARCMFYLERSAGSEDAASADE